MTICKELDNRHTDAVIQSMTLCHRLHYASHTVKDSVLVRRLATQMQDIASDLATRLHALLLLEGFHSTYEPALYGDKEAIKVYLTTIHSPRTYYHTIVITVHPRHHTLIYYNGPPFMGTTQELIHKLHDAQGRELTKIRCSGCHYINTELWVCGMGRVLDVECRDYVARPMVTGGCGGYIGRTQL